MPPPEPYYQDEHCTIYHGDCLELMKFLPKASTDLILTDPPYGTTACKWDKVASLPLMWAAFDEIIKPSGAMVITASQPFSSILVASNLNQFRYEWIWNKKIPSGMAYARYQPMRQHETVLVFGKGKIVYNAQKTQREKPIKSGGMTGGESTRGNPQSWKPLKKTYDTKNPTTILAFDKVRKGSLHPTQKPIPLFEYLIKTYAVEGALILDPFMGSGTTLIAARNLGFKSIGIDQDARYCEIAKKRLTGEIGLTVQEQKLVDAKAAGQMNLLDLIDNH